MKRDNISAFILLFSVFVISFPIHAEEKKNNHASLPDDEIVFYSNGSTFSPVIILQSEATVIWTWADSTTSISTTPAKNYGTAQLRKNSLKVTPWSALRRINIGYDALDGGSKNIELVTDQNVSRVENLHLVAPFLREWCSSYNNIDSLDFSNFINIETIECFRSKSLKNVTLINTPKLKRACLEDDGLLNLDLSGSPALEDLRGALNKFKSITFSSSTQKLWHICVRDNPQITSQDLFNDLSIFPEIAELFIWNTNQRGNLIIPSTNLNKNIRIIAYRNQYSSIDLRGSLKSTYFNGSVDISHNSLTSVDISGCIQIKNLDLSDNQLAPEAIDHVLKQVDEYGTLDGTIDLRQNKPPTAIGLTHVANLEERGWIVHIDEVISGSIQQMNDKYSFNVYTDLSDDKIKVALDKVPEENLILEIRNITGVKILNQKILNNIHELSLESPGIYFFTLRSKDWVKTRKFVSYK